MIVVVDGMIGGYGIVKRRSQQRLENIEALLSNFAIVMLSLILVGSAN